MSTTVDASAPPALRTARALRSAVERVAALMAYLAGWSYVACALFITFDIVGRSLFGISSAATVEISGYTLACGISWSLAHTLAERAHVRVDALIDRMPTRTQAFLSVFSLILLGLFAAFLAWSAWSLVMESLLFGAHDTSALHIPMVLPQGIWVAGIGLFMVMILVLLLESALGLFCGRFAEIATLLSTRTIDDEAEEAMEAVGVTPRGEHK